MVVAQFKSGKSTLIGNLLRSLVDGDRFLGHADVVRLSGTAILLDTEMHQSTLDDWLEAQRIACDDRIIRLSLKGSLGSFDLLDDEMRAAWAARLRQYAVEYLILDNMRPVLDVHGLDEHHDVGDSLSRSIPCSGRRRFPKPASCITWAISASGPAAVR